MNDSVSRQAFIWLLVCVSFLMVPHLLRYPVLLFPLLIGCMGWRIMIYQQRVRTLSPIVKVLMVSFTMVAIGLLPYPWVSLETSSAILLVGTLLKLLEIKNHRDTIILVYLAYFVIVTQLLFDQSLLSALYMLTGILLVTASLIALMTRAQGLSWLYPLHYSAKMMGLAVPVMVLVFLFFPRLDPFWAVPQPGHTGKTGLSDRMAPGLISQLAQSYALAFRVSFADAIPDKADLYWRGPTLSHFDGTTWTLNKATKIPLPGIKAESVKTAVQYDMIMEPSGTEGVYPLSHVLASEPAVQVFSDATIKYHKPIRQKMAFQFYSAIAPSEAAKELDTWQRQQALQLPDNYNPKTATLAQNLRKMAVSDRDYMARVQAFYETELFYYTLNPPLYDGNSIDTFLFAGREGFCEHYASSYVVLMRAAGIPARVVTGYQGGEKNPFEGYLAIRQRDAHAWVEVWLPQEGWVTIDPTGFIAPERILMGSQSSLQSDAFFLAQSALPHRHLSAYKWYQYLQQRYDQVNYLWTVSVLSYKGEKQQQLLAALSGKHYWQKVAVFAGIMLLIGLLGLYGVLKYGDKPKNNHAVDKQYHKLLKKMARKGVYKTPSQGPRDFLMMIQTEYPGYYPAVEPIMSLYIQLAYAPVRSPVVYRHRYSKFKQLVRAFG